MKGIDRFNKRFKKFKEIQKPPTVEEQKEEPRAEVKAVTKEPSAEGAILPFCGEHRQIIDGFMNDERVIADPDGDTVRISDKLLIEPFSNALYNGKENRLGEVIAFDGDYFPAGDYSHIDYGAGYKLRNLREVVTSSGIDGASQVVGCAAGNYSVSGNGFYLLSDDADVFGKNVKSAFRGYRAVWRSIAAVYTLDKYDDGILVIDFMCGTVTRIAIRTEFLKKHNRYIFKRIGRDQLPEFDALKYTTVAKEFVKFICNKNSIKFKNSASQNLVISNKIYNVICLGRTEHFVLENRIFTAGREDYSAFAKEYFKDYAKKFEKLSGALIWADHLKNTGLKGDFVDNGKLGGVLEELDYRVKKGIPLWKETLPALKLDRVALGGRLGNYYLVKNNQVIENTFEKTRIDCPEKLKLPAGEKEILFPLSISGITNKRYVAKITLEEPFKKETEFDVTLEYDFNDEKTYSFLLSNKSGKCEMTIEEGEPQKAELPFKMDINSDVDDTLVTIASKIKVLQNIALGRKASYRRTTEDTEKKWEYNSRNTCNEIFALWITLPYDVKRDKANFSFMKNNVEGIIYEFANTDYYDGRDFIAVMYARAVLALFADGYPVTAEECKICFENNNDSVKRHKTVETLVSRILCNPTLAKPEVIKVILKNTQDTVRLLSLPLIANDELLNYLAEHRIDTLSENIKVLKDYLSHCHKRVSKTSPSNGYFPTLLKEIRDYWEFSLGLLKLRGTKFWNGSLAALSDLLPSVIEIENLLYNKIHTFGIDTYVDLCKSACCLDSQQAEMCISRIKFDGIDKSLSLMHPLGYTLITYLEGNPYTHIIGCGLSDNT